MRYKKTIVFLFILATVTCLGGLYYVKARSPKVTGTRSDTPVLVQGGEFVTNLLPNGPYSYIRVQVDIEVDCKKGAAALNKRSSEVKDTILRVLRSKKSDEVVSAEGMDRLAAEMAQRLSGLLGDEGKVTRVLFTEFVVQ
ncbi:MAG TPA: hypothetical protein GXX40_08960 [Firmicutes bacterium]|nr:hypothetical protein [Bacillota bacterium]